MDTSFYDSMNQKTLSTAMKYTFVLQCFWGIKYQINQAMNDK